jgi:hypothetical protein
MWKESNINFEFLFYVETQEINFWHEAKKSYKQLENI